MATPPQPISAGSPREDGSGEKAVGSSEKPPLIQRHSTPPVQPRSNNASPSKVKPLNPTALAHEPAYVKQSGVGSIDGFGGSSLDEQQARTPVPQPTPFEQAAWMNNLSPMMGPTGLSDAEFIHTRNLIPHVQRPALVAVLQSLMDDFPQLAPIIRVRCEKAMTVIMASQQQQQQQNGSGLGSTPTQWQQQQQADAFTPPSVKGGGRGRNSRGSKQDEDQVICAVHGNMRAQKHMQINPATKQYECIPGFHCLVESRDASTAPSPLTSNMVTPTKTDKRRQSVDSAQLSTSPPPAVPAPYLPEGIHLSQSREGTTQSSTGSANGDSVDVTKLESLLQNIRKTQLPDER